MLVIIGMIIVLVSVLTGYLAPGGHLAVLWQPFEFLIIIGASIGAFLIGNPMSIVSKTGNALAGAFKGEIYNKDHYLELLTMLFTIFKFAKTKGMLQLETHIENPEESEIFSRFPYFLKDHHALVFFCDYMRMLTMGSENSHQLGDLMDEEMEVHHHERHSIVSAVQTMGDGMPALGIVAAVLGVIHTMGSINQPPEVLGHLIGAALVGTFMGILLSYGFVAPLASVLGNIYAGEGKYYQCIKAGIIAHMNGYAPAVSVEFARKSIEHDRRPSFYELEKAIADLNAK